MSTPKTALEIIAKFDLIIDSEGVARYINVV